MGVSDQPPVPAEGGLKAATRSGAPVPKLKLPHPEVPFPFGRNIMELGIHLREVRQRTRGMTPEEREWRKKWVLDQKLHPDEPVRVEAIFRQLNPLRRLYRYPWDRLYEVLLEPKLGWKKAHYIRTSVPKVIIATILFWGAWYHIKYASKDWTTLLGSWFFTSERPVTRMAVVWGMTDVPSEVAVENAKGQLKQQLRQILIASLSSSAETNNGGPVKSGFFVGAPGAQNSRLISGDGEANVAKFLKERGYEYSLSVFVAEARLNPGENWKSADNPGSSVNVKAAEQQDVRELAERVWAKLDKKYKWKMRQHRRRRQEELRRQVRENEARLEQAYREKEAELEEIYARRLEELIEKEKILVDTVNQQKSSRDKGFYSQKHELLSQARELERRRFQLQELEEEFSRQANLEKDKMNFEREQLAEREGNLKRLELEVQGRMEREIWEMKRKEREKFQEKIRVYKEEERRLIESVERAKERIKEGQDVRELAERRAQKISELEEKLRQSKSENEISERKMEDMRERARQSTVDYERMRRELERVNREIKSVQTEGSENREKENMKAEIDALKEQVCLHEKAILLKDEECRLKLEHERSKYEDLAEHFKLQSQHIRGMSRELAKLRSRLDAAIAAIPEKKIVRKKAVATRIDLNNSTPSAISETELSSASTPDFVKDARLRLRQLDLEAENLNESLKVYQREKDREASLKRLRWSDNHSNVIEAEEPGEETLQSLPEIQPLAESTRLLPVPVPQKSKESAKKEVGAAGPKKKKKEEEKMEKKDSPEKKSDMQQPPPSSDGTTSAVKESWEERLRKREEERKKKDEEARKEEEERLRKLEEEEEEQKKREEEKGKEERKEKTVEPEIDPVMQHYMKMVLEQRKVEKEKGTVSPRKDRKKSEEAAKAKETDVVIDPNIIETGNLSPGAAADDEFW